MQNQFCSWFNTKFVLGFFLNHCQMVYQRSRQDCGDGINHRKYISLHSIVSRVTVRGGCGSMVILFLIHVLWSTTAQREGMGWFYHGLQTCIVFWIVHCVFRIRDNLLFTSQCCLLIWRNIKYLTLLVLLTTNTIVSIHLFWWQLSLWQQSLMWLNLNHSL